VTIVAEIHFFWAVLGGLGLDTLKRRRVTSFAYVPAVWQQENNHDSIREPNCGSAWSRASGLVTSFVSTVKVLLQSFIFSLARRVDYSKRFFSDVLQMT
jgi:hypothetical protein